MARKPNSPTSDGEESQEVGYGRPPKDSQFQPGKSGNPKGRPKANRDSFLLVNEELDKIVTVTENGRQRRVTKRHLMITQLVNQAAKGDRKCAELVMRLADRPDSNAANDDSGMTQAMIANILQRFSLNGGANE